MLSAQSAEKRGSSGCGRCSQRGLCWPSSSTPAPPSTLRQAPQEQAIGSRPLRGSHRGTLWGP
eukprot:5890986-Prorocentrum_lima.AAC.1